MNEKSTEQRAREVFEAAQEERLKDTHPVLATVLKRIAWEDGHAYGYNQVLNCLDIWIDEFEEVNKLLKEKN